MAIARPRGGPAPARAGPQPRPAAGQARARRRSIGSQRALGRRHRSADGARRDPRRDRRPRDRPAARRAARLPDGRAAAALRRLRDARHALAHDGRGDDRHAGDPRRAARAAGGRDAADPRARDHAARASRSRTCATPTPSSSRCRWTGAAPAALDTAVDGVRERFGKEAITRAVLLDRDPGVSMPLLPD